MSTMKAVAFRGANQIAIEERPVPIPRAGEAVIRITTTTICGTDVHIVKGEEAFDLFSHQRGGVLKVALHPAAPLASIAPAGSLAHVAQR